MKTHLIAAAVAAAAFVSTGILAQASAADCMDTCTARHTTCVASGRDDATCLGGWHQCKTTCAATKAAPVRTSPAPLASRPANPVKVASTR